MRVGGAVWGKSENYLSILFLFFHFHFLIRSLEIAFHDVMKALMEINPSRHQSRPRRKRIRNLSPSFSLSLILSFPFFPPQRERKKMYSRKPRREKKKEKKREGISTTAAVRLRNQREVQSLKSLLTRRR